MNQSPRFPSTPLSCLAGVIASCLLLQTALAQKAHPASSGSSRVEDAETDRRNDVILADDVKKNLRDIAELVELARDLKAELEKDGTLMVPTSTIKDTQAIEKLAKNIRGRLKKYPLTAPMQYPKPE